MADEELVKWIRNAGPGALRRADLRGADLRGANLFRANLCDSDLRNANLSDANLSGADLSDADFRDADFRGADLRIARLRGTNLRSASLHLADLSGADLLCADLRGADLRRAKLRSAQLESANLSDAALGGTDLGDTNFFGANLFRANLSDADFRGANLSDANLSDANLVSADLSDASLRGARLGAARVGWSTFGDTDLSGAVGLDDVEHVAPSSVGIDTLYRSKGKIPDVFLRGCGVPENLIEYHRSLVVPGAIDLFSCFISYSHEDKAFARRLYDALQMRGIRCWLDEKQLVAGDDIYDEVDRGIRLWDKVILCASESSLSSWWVENEIAKGFKKEQQLRKETGKKVLALIPLNLDGYLFQWENGKADQVRERLAPDFTKWKDHDSFEEQLELVVRALRTDGGKEEPPEPKLGR